MLVQAHISDQLVARKGGVLFVLVGEEVHVVKIGEAEAVGDLLEVTR